MSQRTYRLLTVSERKVANGPSEPVSWPLGIWLSKTTISVFFSLKWGSYSTTNPWLLSYNQRILSTFEYHQHRGSKYKANNLGPNTDPSGMPQEEGATEKEFIPSSLPSSVYAKTNNYVQEKTFFNMCICIYIVGKRCLLFLS